MIAKTTLALAVIAAMATACAQFSRNSARTGTTYDSAASGASVAAANATCDRLSGAEKAQCLREETGSSSKNDFGMQAASGRNAGYGSNPSGSGSGGAASEGGGDGSGGSGH